MLISFAIALFQILVNLLRSVKHFATMENIGVEKGLYVFVLAELKALGVKVPKVKKVKPVTAKQEKGITENGHKIFGASLSDQEWITDSDSDCPLPKFIAEATDYLKTYTQAEIGLFRKAGSVARQRELRAKLEDGGNFANCEPNDVASLLKQWLRELPEPLIPVYLHDLFVRCQSLDSEDERVNAVMLSCLLLPSEHLYTLKHLLKFLRNMAANCDINKMSVHNLAVIMAPNLLPSGNDNAGKSSNLVQCYTSIVETLIANADLVGAVPQKITDQLSEESSDYQADGLDCSPHKNKKKFRNGVGGGNVVTDFVSGIKKIVGGNVTPMNTFLDVPDGHLLRSSTRKKTFREGSMSETPFFTPAAKISRITAPLNGFGTNTPLSHFRRKSFGLLSKKHRKRATSVLKSDGQSKESDSSMQGFNTPCSPSVVFRNVTMSMSEEENKSEPVCNITVSVDIKVIPPTETIENTNIKRAVSDCLLGSEKIDGRKRSVNSLSTGHLPTKRPSSLNLQGPNVKRRSSRNNKNEVERKTSVKRHSYRNLTDSGSPPNSQKLSKTNSLKDGKSDRRQSTSSRRGPHSKGRASTNDSFSTVDALPNETATQRKLRSSSRRHSSNAKSTRKTARNSDKNELKSNSESQICNSQRQNADNNGDGLMETHLNSQINVFISETPTDPSKKTLPGSLKRNLNKSSLKRGRPNTVKTGLPSELCPKYSYDSMYSKLERSQSIEESKHGACIQKETVAEVLDKDSDCVNCEIFSICSKDGNLTNKTNINSVCSTMPENIESAVKTSENENVACIAAALSDLELNQSFNHHTEAASPDVQGKSNIKTRKMHKRMSSTDVSILSPTLKLAQSEALESNADESKANDYPACQHDSVPDKENIYPDEIWHSEAESYINANLIPVETNCKRESIIQIMIKNAGKVRENVQRYDHIAKDKHHSSLKGNGSTSKTRSNSKQLRETKKALTETFSVSPSIYADRSFTSPGICTRSYSQNHSSTEGNKATRSQSKRNSKMTKSPLPLPPKFVCENEKTTPITPLREVTNLTSSAKKMSNSSKSFKILSDSSPCLTKDSPLSEGSKRAHSSFSKKDSVLKRLRRKERYSYEGESPKITKESRSESSPLLTKLDGQTPHFKDLSQSPLLRKSFHSSSFNVPPSRTASRVSIRDINDLKNTLVIDAWECKM